jgi:predicted dehydrogenase
MNKIRTAIIGPGKVGHTHARILAALPASEFVAVCGRTAEKTRAFAAQYGVRAYTNLPTMLHEAGVKMLVICTPHPQHVEAAVTAAAAGVHVLVEKPMAVTPAQCDAMIAAASENEVKLGMVSQRRLYEPVARVKQAIETGKVEPILGTVTVLGWRGPEYYAMDPWRGKWDAEGGGVLVNQTSHQLDLFQWLMGPVEEVFGYWDNLNHPYIEVEDTAVAVLRFKNGALGNIVVSNSQNPGLYGNIHIHGRDGATIGVQTDGGSMFVAGVTAKVDPPMNDLWTVPGEAELLPQWQAQDRLRADQVDVMSHYHRLIVEDFLHAILDDRPPLVPGEEGRKAVDLFTAIYRSGRERRPVRLGEEQTANCR